MKHWKSSGALRAGGAGSVRALFAALGLALLLSVLPKNASAGYFELSGGFSFSNSNYGAGDYEWTRRWTASLGYHFSEHSEMEVSIQDVVNRTAISGYQDTTFHDQTYSVDWVQSLFGRESLIDPYFKFGVGQLNHIANGTYYSLGGASADAEVDSLTEILGVGLRIGLSKRMGARIEADTYITNWQISSWRDNSYFTVGLSFYF